MSLCPRTYSSSYSYSYSSSSSFALSLPSLKQPFLTGMEFDNKVLLIKTTQAFTIFCNLSQHGCRPAAHWQTAAYPSPKVPQTSLTIHLHNPNSPMPLNRSVKNKGEDRLQDFHITGPLWRVETRKYVDAAMRDRNEHHE